jgi:hypothetical protein
LDNSKTGIMIAAALGGAVFLWSGISNKGVLATTRDLVQGNKPAAGGKQSFSIGLNGSGAVAGGTAGGTAAVPAATGGLSTYNHLTLAALWQANGGSVGTANNAACHAMQESSGNPRAQSGNPDGGINYGLWQLDTRGVGSGYTPAQLMDPDTNARITVQATRDGADWSEWSTPGC